MTQHAKYILADYFVSLALTAAIAFIVIVAAAQYD